MHYALDSVPTGENASTIHVLATWPGRYATPTGGAAWIGVDNGGTDVNEGTYVFELAFDLTGLDPSTAAIDLAFAADNEVSISLNGTGTGLGATGDAAIETLTSGSITSGFVPGVNMLSFYVENVPLPNGNAAPVNASGLLVDSIAGTAQVASAVPLPVPGALLLGVLAGLATVRRSRR